MPYALSFIPAAYLCHGLMQLDTLVELDIGGNQIPEAFQSLLQVSLALLSSLMLVYYNLQLTHAAYAFCMRTDELSSFPSLSIVLEPLQP